MKLLWRNGINPAKVVLGLGFYGRSYTLANPSCNKPGCVFTSGAPGGPCTDSIGTLSYGEIQRLIDAGAKPVLDTKAAVQTLTYGGNNWVSYDDQTTFKMKIDYANNNCLGGTMVWAASTDDSKGSAAAALSAASGNSIGPLGTRIGIVIPDNPGLCSWTQCGGRCPAGTTAAAYVLDGCPQPNTNPFTYRLFCCPSNDVPDCNQRVQDFQGQTCVAGSCPAGTQLLTTTQFILVPFELCPAGGHINCKSSPICLYLRLPVLTYIDVLRVLFPKQIPDKHARPMLVDRLRGQLPQRHYRADTDADRGRRRLALHQWPAQPLLPNQRGQRFHLQHLQLVPQRLPQHVHARMPPGQGAASRRLCRSKLCARLRLVLLRPSGQLAGRSQRPPDAGLPALCSCLYAVRHLFCKRRGVHPAQEAAFFAARPRQPRYGPQARAAALRLDLVIE